MQVYSLHDSTGGIFQITLFLKYNPSEAGLHLRILVVVSVHIRTRALWKVEQDEVDAPEIFIVVSADFFMLIIS